MRVVRCRAAKFHILSHSMFEIMCYTLDLVSYLVPCLFRLYETSIQREGTALSGTRPYTDIVTCYVKLPPCVCRCSMLKYSNWWHVSAHTFTFNIKAINV